MEFFITIFLMPWFVFKYVFSFAFWFYGTYILINTEWWEEMAEDLKSKWLS